MARLIPRVRTAGSANAIPSGTVAARPIRRPSQNGMPCVAISRPATQRAEAGERELRERQLAGVAREHDDREQDQRDAEGDRERVHPDRRRHDHEHDRERGAEHDPGPVEAPRSDGRQALEQVVAQRKGLPADDHPDDDDEERHRASPVGRGEAPARVVQLGDVAVDLGLGDAHGHAGGERDREGLEARDERRRRRRQHEVRHHRRLERRDRGDQDRRQAGETAAEPPVDRGDRVRRPAQRGRGPLVLCHRRRAEAEAGVPVQPPERGRGARPRSRAG